MDLVQSGLVACLGPSLIACLAVLAGGCLLHRRFAWLRPLSLAAPLMLVAGFLYLGLPACQPELAAQALPYLRAAWYFGLASLAARLLDAALIGHLLIRVRGRSIPGILRSLFLILAHFLAALWVLRVQLDLDVTSLLATSAVVSFVVGLASQDLLGSILAGIVIGVERPISPGDWVRVDGVEGRVVDATWRRCRVMTRDGAFVLIPNATVMKGTVTNYTMPDRRHRLSVPLGVHYRHPPSQVKQALLEAAATCQAVLADPPPSIFLTVSAIRRSTTASTPGSRITARWKRRGPSSTPIFGIVSGGPGWKYPIPSAPFSRPPPRRPPANPPCGWSTC